MKTSIIGLACILICSAVLGELSEDQIKQLQRYVRVSSIRDQSVRDENRNKIQVISFFTTQSDQDVENYAVRVTAELEDSDDNTYCVQKTGKQEVTSGYEYAGQDQWEVRIPEGDLSRPRISAYVIEYGKMEDSVFIPVVTENKGAETPEEIVNRCTNRLESGVSMWHSFYYTDYSGDGQQQTQSILKKLK